MKYVLTHTVCMHFFFGGEWGDTLYIGFMHEDLLTEVAWVSANVTRNSDCTWPGIVGCQMMSSCTELNGPISPVVTEPTRMPSRLQSTSLTARSGEAPVMSCVTIFMHMWAFIDNGTVNTVTVRLLLRNRN